VREGDIVIALGAGDINSVVRDLNARLLQSGGAP
jgi:UDP-N-acetylmuramate-alanine ligase